MLKITRVAALNQEVTLRLDGSVSGPWVELLRTSAELVVNLEMRLTLDLENICYVDCEGVGLIKHLINRGTLMKNVPLFVAEQISKCEGE
jgi:ABC-type transporter Mla MlaB component